MTVDVPRNRDSEAAARVAAKKAAYAANLAEMQACTWRVGAVGWSWQIARRTPDGRWETLPGELEHYPAEDLAQHRRRLTPWLTEQLGVTQVWLRLDYQAEEAGRLVFEVEVKG